MSISTNNFIQTVQTAIKIINEVDESIKVKGFESLAQVLSRNNPQLVEYGYNHVVFKELIKITQFDSGTCLEKSLELLQEHYFTVPEHHDELAETLIYRAARSTDFEVRLICLKNFSILVDSLGDRIAKHSKQVLKLADLNEMIDLNPIITEILIKMKSKVPARRRL